MKKPLFLFFIFYYTFHFAQDECGQAGGYTGVLIEKQINGAKKEENVYLNGVKHGVCISYYLDGTIRSKEKYQLGKFIELLLAPDPTHDAKDYKTLHPPKNYTYNQSYTKSDEPPSKWNSTKNKINDTVFKENWFYDGNLQREITYVNSDKRNIKQYFVKNLPSNLPNENSDISWLQNKWHGKSIHYSISGKIISAGNYNLWRPVGTHYLYYNNAEHQIKTITYYNSNNSDLKTGFSKKLYCIKKKYDTLGIYRGYEIHYALSSIDISEDGGAIKVVAFLKDSAKNTWESTGYYNNEIATIYGEIEHGAYKINYIKTKSGKSIVRKGDAKYHNDFLPLTDILYNDIDTLTIPSNCGTNTTWNIYLPEPIAPIIPQYYFIGYEQASYDHSMFNVPYKEWKGRIKDGFLTGKWSMEDENYIMENIKTKTSFYGVFEKSLKEGIWHYENDFYFYDINYVNGKKEGKLKPILKPFDYKKLNERKTNYYNERYYDYNTNKNKLPDLYNNMLSFWTGNFKNNEMDGEWIAYYRYPDLIAFKAIFNNGYLIAKTDEYNLKQQLIAKRTIENNNIKTEKFYTPLGDEFENKYCTNNSYQSILLEKENSIAHGKYLMWDNYTGEIYDKGFYRKGLKHGNWYNVSSGDTTIQNFKNDTLHGFYKNYNSIYNNKYYIYTSGYYQNGEKSGLWKYKNSNDSLFKEEIYIDNEKYLLTYTFKNKKCIEKGNGFITSEESGLQTKSEEHYKDGKLYKTVLIYNQNNQIASIIYSTPHGDSIAYYMPPESGTCIKNGTGMKTYFDYKKRISKIEYYIKGKIIKNDLYNDGRLSNTYYYRFASDTAENIKGKVLVEKEISKPFNENTYLYVTIRITNMPKNTTSLTIDDYFNSIYELEITDSDGFNVSQKTTGSFHLVRNKPINSNVIEIKYKYQSNNGETFGNNAKIRYLIDKKHYELSPYYYRIH